MKKISSLLLILLLTALCSYAQDSVGTNKEEKKVLRLVNSLPEVVRENEYRRKAHIGVFLKAYIQNTPTKQNNYYKVTICEEKEERLFTYDWYEVDCRTYKISYDDIVTGKTISLKEWRKHLGNRFKK
jgi:hypothetical protein